MTQEELNLQAEGLRVAITETLQEISQIFKKQLDQEKKLAITPKKRIVGLKALADKIGVSKPTAQKLKDSGRISYIKVGNKFFFDEEEVFTELSIKKTA